MLKTMKEKIKERIKAWKKVFVAECDGLDENSAWKDILLKLKLSPSQTLDLVAKASDECGVFSSEERTFLYDLPYYADTLAIVKKYLWDGCGHIASIPFMGKDKAYFLIYPKENELQAKENIATVIEAVIVMKQPPKLDIDVYTFLPGMAGARNLVVRYDTQIPQEWLDEKKKYDALQKNQRSHISEFNDDAF